MPYQIDIRKFKSFPQFKKRFFSQISHNWFLDIKQDSCWIWLGAVTGNGYGQIGWGE